MTEDKPKEDNHIYESIPLCAQCDEELTCPLAYTRLEECLARYRN